ncbi:phosphate acetyl/butaryl transferase-domain-containing protein [Haematococcus lacustris]
MCVMYRLSYPPVPSKQLAGCYPQPAGNALSPLGPPGSHRCCSRLWLERHLPSVGFFVPIAGESNPQSASGVDRHAELLHSVFSLPGDVRGMQGTTEAEANKMIANGKQASLLDTIYDRYTRYRERHDFVLIQGPGGSVGGTELDAQVAQALSSPVLLTINGDPRMTAAEYFDLAMVKRQLFHNHKVDVLGVAINSVPQLSHLDLTNELRERFSKEGLAFAGAMPADTLLSSVRLDEVAQWLRASVLFGKGVSLDKEFSDIIIGSQRVEELLEMLEARDSGSTPPLVVTSLDRTDLVLALLAAQVSVQGPTVAGVLLTQAGATVGTRRYARDTVARIFAGIQEGSSYTGAMMPVLLSDKPIYEVMTQLRHQASQPRILPSSSRKVLQSKMLFDRYINAELLVSGLETERQKRQAAGSMTPKMFQHNLKALCIRTPQRIVLPESNDPRVLAAAAEVTAHGLAKVTLLGEPTTVAAEATKLGLDLTGINIVNPATSDLLDKYVDALCEARKKKGLVRDAALDQVKNDVNMFGVLMVHCGDVDGMVSGALHTTAATIRPAMQVLACCCLHGAP